MPVALLNSNLILELAVRGKLVSQKPADEPASELYRRLVDEEIEVRGH
jgi:hypothetical protein